MRATGIVRRIDDLGRVVIPKDIRRTLKIKEGDPMELFITKDGEVVFKKYEPFEDHDWAKARAIISAMYPNLQFGLYNDFGDKQTATNVTFARTIDIDEPYYDDLSIITSEMDTIGFIDFKGECPPKEDCEKIRAMLRHFFSTNF